MSTYTKLSNDVNRAVTNGDHELGELLKKEIEPLAGNPRYRVLLDILDKMPAAGSIQPAKSSSIKPSIDGQRVSPQRERFMTLTEAKAIVRAHNDYVKKHRALVQGGSGITRKHRKLNKLQRMYESEIERLTPTSINAGKKLEMAKDLLGMQTENSIDREGSLVMSPRFQGGRMLGGGLPGSKR